MKKLICLIVFSLLFSSKVCAYKVFYYDAEGNRVYKTIEQKDFAVNKNRKRRAYVRTPRTNWEITDEMRARKKTFYYKGKN